MPILHKVQQRSASGLRGEVAGKQAPLRQVTLRAQWPADLKGISPVYFTPVFILVEDGREVGRFAGYFEKEFFWGQLDQLFAKVS